MERGTVAPPLLPCRRNGFSQGAEPVRLSGVRDRGSLDVGRMHLVQGLEEVRSEGSGEAFDLLKPIPKVCHEWMAPGASYSHQ